MDKDGEKISKVFLTAIRLVKEGLEKSMPISLLLLISSETSWYISWLKVPTCEPIFALPQPSYCAAFLHNKSPTTYHPSQYTNRKTELRFIGYRSFYSRPGMKGRKILATLPYGKVWRTGANGATTLTFGDDVTIGGTKNSCQVNTGYPFPGEKNGSSYQQTNWCDQPWRI